MTLNTKQNKSTSGVPKRHKDREIARLRRELVAERRHTAELERELASLKREQKENALATTDQPLRKLKQKAGGTHKEERLLDTANRRAARYRKNTYLLYLLESVRESLPVQLIKSFSKYFRRVKSVQTVVTIVLALAAVVTVAVISTTVLLFLFLGITLLILLALLIYLRAKHMNHVLEQAMTDRRIRILVPPRGPALNRGSFFIRNARAMACEDNVAVLIVSPYLFSNRGAGGRGGFFIARKEAEGLYIVRRHYFFVLRRKVLDALGGDVTAVY